MGNVSFCSGMHCNGRIVIWAYFLGVRTISKSHRHSHKLFHTEFQCSKHLNRYMSPAPRSWRSCSKLGYHMSLRIREGNRKLPCWRRYTKWLELNWSVNSHAKGCGVDEAQGKEDHLQSTEPNRQLHPANENKRLTRIAVVVTTSSIWRENINVGT